VQLEKEIIEEENQTWKKMSKETCLDGLRSHRLSLKQKINKPIYPVNAYFLCMCVFDLIRKEERGKKNKKQYKINQKIT